jgi:mannan endo-1,4-beta-mannosidase
MSSKLRRLSVLVLLAALVAAALSLPAASPPAAGANGPGFENFITKSVDKLWDGSQEYRFLSAATPTLQLVEDNFPFEDRADFEWRWADAYEIRDTLESIKQMGGQATRIYCLSVKRSIDRPGTPRDIVAPASLPDGSINPAAFNEDGFRVLDQILATANELGIRVVIPITNQYDWHGGYQSLAALRGLPSSQFWTNVSLRNDYKAIVKYLLNRTNTITGVQYKNDKAILAWSYGNELNSATNTWINEMGAYIRSIDPNHLIMHHITNTTIPSSVISNAYVDVVGTSIYDNFGNVTVPRIISQKNATRGKKPYVTFEFGFASTAYLETIMNTIISTGTSGGQLWGLRPHNREGGFYWHGEGTSGPLYLLRSYHWPGYPSGDRYDESLVMTLLRNKAYEIQGLTAPAIAAPEAPTMLPIDSPAAISWQGSVGARSYVLERATSAAGPWTTLDDEVYDDVAYTPIYNDSSVVIGQQYFYRVSAQNEAGISEPSNVVGPVPATSRRVVDNLNDFSQTEEHTANLTIEQRNNRVVLERLSRVVRSAAVPGEYVVYRIDGRPNWFKVFTFFQATETTQFAFSASADGVGYEPLAATATQYGEGPGTYGYWYRVLYEGGLPADARYLKIEFPDLTDATTPALSRVEIDYSPAPVASNDAPAGGPSVQYSDALDPAVTVSATDPNSPGSALTAGAVGLPAGLSLALASTDDSVPGARTWTVAGTVDAGPGVYPVDVTVTDEEGNQGSTSFTINVTKEDAEATYTGDELAFTEPGGSTASVELRATVRDSSLYSSDSAPGDVRNASVSFKEGSTTLCGPLTVQLLGSETTIGTATCDVSLGLGSHEIGVYVGGYYVGEDLALVEVAEPDGSFVTGGGQRKVEASAGTYAGTAGSKIHFGFNVKYNKNNKTLKGHANLIFVSGERTYQIKSTALASLGIALRTEDGNACSGPPSELCIGKADLRSKANLVDVTDPNAPVSVASNLTLRITVTDKGEPGSSDSIGITLWNGDTLLFASEWTGAATVEGMLGGGNIAVH